MIFQSVCTSFKKELLEAIHDFTSDAFYLALYDSTATLDESTTAYSVTNEITGTGYTAGGFALTAVAPTTDGLTALADFNDLTTPALTVSGVRGGLIYNSSKANRAVAVLDFGRSITKTAETMTVTFPTADQLNAIVRIK